MVNILLNNNIKVQKQSIVSKNNKKYEITSLHENTKQKSSY